MEEPQQQTLQTDDEATLVVSGEETTLVAPRFDDEETQVARPVVPLEGDAHSPAQDHTTARRAPGYRRPFAPPGSGMLALALVSVLVGGVLGGAGLYLYQRQSQASAVSPAAVTTQPADDAAQAPATESQAAPPAESQAQQAEAPASAEPNAEGTTPPAPDEEVPAAPPAREPESIPAAGRRDAPAAGGGNDTRKRGKKGEHDEGNAARATPRPGGNVARADESEARQVDTIFYRQRRAERRAARRARRDDTPDRLRRIFEGTPE